MGGQILVAETNMEHHRGFADVLRQYRLARELTQEELAEQAGLSTRTISDLERGVKQTPQRATTSLLIKALALTSPDADAFEAAARRRGNRLGRVAKPSEPDREAVDREVASTSWLPRPLTPMIGRAHELAALRTLLLQVEARLVTLIGPAGVGKTRLALAVAHVMQSQFAGVRFVDLTAATDARLVMPEIATRLGLREDPVRSPLQVSRDYARGRRQLIVVDNFEQVVGAAIDLASLLAAAPGLKLLVTSRAALRVTAEYEFPVGPLSLPDPSHLPTLSRLRSYAAVRLFIDRARAIEPVFALTEENAATIALICHRLDGLPLAIELAAARVRLLPPATLLERLSDPLGTLSDGPRDRPPRQQTLRNAIGWSYALLEPGEQALFRQLAVFPDSCTLDAAESICAPEGEREPLDVLQSLVAQSLLRRVEPAKGPVRVSMLPLVREYARERLKERGEDEATGRRHATYFRELAETAEPHLIGAASATWLQRLDEDLTNIRGALEWALVRGQSGDLAAVTDGLRLAGALW